MIELEKIDPLRTEIERLKSRGLTIGFVPTMGALHPGHISLVQESKAVCDITVVSIFVNPTQFNHPEDFETYPRTIDRDRGMLSEVECDILFIPTVAQMYESPDLEIKPLSIGYLDTILEGAKRPGHYRGVTTIVEKLFRAVSPDKVFMGLKDYQQVKVVEYLIKERFPNMIIAACPTLREKNGLAMSSRNMRLSSKGKELASSIFRSLNYIADHRGMESPARILAIAIGEYLSRPEFQLEYLEIRHARDLSAINSEHWGDGDAPYVALIAIWVEGVRLIDNTVF